MFTSVRVWFAVRHAIMRDRTVLVPTHVLATSPKWSLL